MQRVKMGLPGLVVLLVMVTFAFVSTITGPAQAQSGQAPAFEQIELTDAHVKGYIGASGKLADLLDRVEKAGGEPGEKLLGELEQLAKANGFKSFEEMELAIANITFVMSGFGNEANDYLEPVEALKKERADIKADKELKADEKTQMLQEIDESIKFTPKVKFPANVELIRKHYADLIKLFD